MDSAVLLAQRIGFEEEREIEQEYDDTQYQNADIVVKTLKTLCSVQKSKIFLLDIGCNARAINNNRKSEHCRVACS